MSPRVSELRLVLLGKTGAGRRAAGNTILGKEDFGAEASPSSQDQRSRRREGNVCGRQMVLVDTPDFSERPREDMRQDVGLSMRLSAPGPHAFLLVIPVEPSEREIRAIMEKMEEMFGESCWEHSVVVFPHTDTVKEQSVEELLQAGSQELQHLVEKCENRWHVLDIKDRSHDSQVSELLEKIENMVAGKPENFYSTQIYQEAESKVRVIERKIQKEREERKHMEEKEMRETFENEIKDSLKKIEGSIQKLEGDIRKLNHRISELNSQMREEGDEEKKRGLKRELKRESRRRKETERKLERFRAEAENERREMEERHRQEIEEMREKYERQTRVEAEINLMKILLPELQNILVSKSNVQRELGSQVEELKLQLKETSHPLSFNAYVVIRRFGKLFSRGVWALAQWSRPLGL